MCRADRPDAINLTVITSVFMSIDPSINHSDKMEDRLGVRHLLGLTACIAASLALVQLIKRLRFPADNWYWGVTEVHVGVGDLVLAFVYGIGMALAIFALRTAKSWQSPGKTIAIILGAACLIHWGLDLGVACIMAIRFDASDGTSETYVFGEPDSRGYILGTWYSNVTIYYGYLLSLPILLAVLFRTRRHLSVWTLAWIASIVFVISIIGRDHFGWNLWLPVSLRSYYFASAMLIPIFAITIAFFCDLFFYRQRLDWWTNSAVAAIMLGLITMAAMSL